MGNGGRKCIYNGGRNCIRNGKKIVLKTGEILPLGYPPVSLSEPGWPGPPLETASMTGSLSSALSDSPPACRMRSPN